MRCLIESDTQGRVTEWTKQAETMFGWTRDEILGVNVFDSVLRDRASWHAVKELVDNKSSMPSCVQLEQRSYARNGDQIEVEVTVWRTTVHGETRINGFFRDISARKRHESEREAMIQRQRLLVEELRQADKAKSDFVSLVSHELRTPLTSITGYLEMMTDGSSGPIDQGQSRMLGVIQRNSHRLLMLIDDLLTLSRIGSATLDAAGTAVDVATLISGIEATMLPSAHDRHVSIEIDVDDQTGSVVGNSDQLERVLMNLMSNALKFTLEGGSVVVRAFRRSDNIYISVADTGIGIPFEEQQQLFSRFFRASTATEHAVEGTGLGLAIVKGIVDCHGGTVSITSEPNVGTTVTVELPAATIAGPVGAPA